VGQKVALHFARVLGSDPFLDLFELTLMGRCQVPQESELQRPDHAESRTGLKLEVSFTKLRCTGVYFRAFSTLETKDVPFAM
jgi:hypothetical protein